MRINVVGTSGSGKSTFARALAKKLRIPYIEIDAVFWEPNWAQPSDGVFFDRLSKAIQGPDWVLDGNYQRTQPVKWKAVDTVIWLDYPFSLGFYRSLKRSLARIATRKELWPGTGNRESLARTFLSKDSILLWVLKTFPTVRSRYLEDMQSPVYSHIRFVRLRSPEEAERYLAAIPLRKQ